MTGLLVAAVRAVPFDHTEHATLFVRCETCHAGAAATDRPLWPAPAECSACHDGKIEKAVTWTPRTGPLPSNLRFTHDVHRSAFAKAQPRDSALSCAACHSTPGAKWMTVQRDVIGNCLACHKAGPDHFEAQPGQCATCHVPFWEMPAGVTTAQVATWKAPASHAAADFQSTHGKLAGPVVVDGKNARRVPVMRDLSCAGVLHHLSRECARSPSHPGAPAGSAFARDGESRVEGTRVARRDRRS